MSRRRGDGGCGFIFGLLLFLGILPFACLDLRGTIEERRAEREWRESEPIGTFDREHWEQVASDAFLEAFDGDAWLVGLNVKRGGFYNNQDDGRTITGYVHTSTVTELGRGVRRKHFMGVDINWKRRGEWAGPRGNREKLDAGRWELGRVTHYTCDSVE